MNATDEEPDGSYYTTVIVPAVNAVYRDLVRDSPGLDVPVEFMIAAVLQVYTAIKGDVVGVGALEMARNFAYGIPADEQTEELAIGEASLDDVVHGDAGP